MSDMTIITENPNKMEGTPIQKFYVGQNIFITGGTGFLGKVLIEKLLRSCPELSSIYLLLRPKKGKDVNKRLKDIFDDPVFGRLKEEQPKFQNKIIALAGDCSLPNLGLSTADKELLQREISIVFHVAATVRFDEKIKYAATVNVSGTMAIMDMCRGMHSLKSIIYVSTAYSNCNRIDIDETCYHPPMTGKDLEKLTQCLDENMLDKITPMLLKDHPNTYTFTKAIAEDTVKKAGKDLPVGIFRPAMVISTSFEPIEGWIDNIQGPTGGAVGTGAGLVRVLRMDEDCTAELVPVDLTVNALIASAWDVATDKKDAVETPIYNYVSTWDEKGISWGQFVKFAMKYGMQTPSIRSIWCYIDYNTKYTFLYNLLTIILHIIPAMIVDTALFVTGQRPRAMKIYKKIHKFLAATSYFSEKTWKFQLTNTRTMWNKLTPEDRSIFFFSMRHFDWDAYMRKYISGLRLYIFKDDPSTITAARKRMSKLVLLHNILKYSFFALLLWLLYSLTRIIVFPHIIDSGVVVR